MRKGRATRWMETTIDGISTWVLMTIDQYPTVTTQWIETTINGVSTWTSYVYTQTFPEAPDEWQGPRAGSIGLGSPSKGAGKSKILNTQGTSFSLAMLVWMGLVCLGAATLVVAW